MATTGSGRLVGEDADAVRYEFGSGPDAIEGTVVIPVSDPGRWYVDGGEERSVLARNVLQKALRLQRRDGARPRDASFFS